MIHTETLEHIVRLAIYTPFIKRENPVSIMVIAPVEHGKSEILKKFAFVESVKITTDFNSFIFSEFAFDILNGKKRTLIIPDFLRVVKKKYATASNSLTILNALCEEGWIGSLPLGQKIDKPIKANVLTAVTESEMIDKRHKWHKMGFLSRFIPVSYSYFDKTKQQIREYIKDRIYDTDKPYELTLPKEKIDIALPKDMANKLEKITLEISDRNNITGFRLQKQLQVLAMANALASQRNIVTESDVDTIKELAKFINFEFNKI